MSYIKENYVKDKVIIITGASSGFGRAAARKAAALGGKERGQAEGRGREDTRRGRRGVLCIKDSKKMLKAARDLYVSCCFLLPSGYSIFVMF